MCFAPAVTRRRKTFQVNHANTHPYSFEFVKRFGHLFGVKGGDSGGKSVSSCEPAESERIMNNSFRRVTAGA